MYWPGKNAAILSFDTDTSEAQLILDYHLLRACFSKARLSPCFSLQPTEAGEGGGEGEEAGEGTSAETEMHSSTVQNLITMQISYSNRH